MHVTSAAAACNPRPASRGRRCFCGVCCVNLSARYVRSDQNQQWYGVFRQFYALAAIGFDRRRPCGQRICTGVTRTMVARGGVWHFGFLSLWQRAPMLLTPSFAAPKASTARPVAGRNAFRIYAPQLFHLGVSIFDQLSRE